MKTRITVVLMIVATLALCLAVSQPAIASDEEEVLEVAENWAKAFRTSDSELMSSIHWQSPEHSRFTPSVGAAFLSEGWDAEGTKETFDVPAGALDLTVYNPQVTMLDDEVAVLTAYQIMNLNPPIVPVQISNLDRLTLVVKKIGGKWLIVHSHQSHFPVE